jgi:hypothetical protein
MALNTTALVKKFLKSFSVWLDKSNTSTVDDFECFIAKKFHIQRNGHSWAKSSAEYFDAVQAMRKKYSHVKLSLIGKPIVAGNKVVIQFIPTFKLAKGKSEAFHIMAIATIKNGRISDWNEVAHQI